MLHSNICIFFCPFLHFHSPTYDIHIHVLNLRHVHALTKLSTQPRTSKNCISFPPTFSSPENYLLPCLCHGSGSFIGMQLCRGRLSRGILFYFCSFFLLFIQNSGIFMKVLDVQQFSRLFRLPCRCFHHFAFFFYCLSITKLLCWRVMRSRFTN